MAIPLTEYLDNEGSYEGFDVVARGTSWCTRKLTPKYPNFRFQFVNVWNKHYNARGKHKASEYKFPFENDSFDFVFLTSVFTHMLPQDMENYLSEVARVLKTGGRCLITFFLLNIESLGLLTAKKGSLDFKHIMGKYRTTDPNVPESAVCYDEAFVTSLYVKHGLKIKEPLHYGSWCGRKDFLSYQDIVIATKI